MTRLIITFSLLAITLGLHAQRTTRRNLKVKENVATVIATDNIIRDSINITISGYDKPLTSHYETLFATNNHSDTILSITIQLNYTTLSGQQLHARQVNIPCNIPSGETRQLQFKSWDTQFNFYYYLSPRPRHRSTPYKATHRIISATIKNSTMNLSHDIFISYSNKDRHIVHKYAAYLESLGYNVWYDCKGLHCGAEFSTTIADAIKSSKLVIFFSSENSNKSDWTKGEILLARKLNKTILPIKIDKTDYDNSIAIILLPLHYIICNDLSDESCSNLQKAVSKYIGPTLGCQQFK